MTVLYTNYGFIITRRYSTRTRALISFEHSEHNGLRRLARVSHGFSDVSLGPGLLLWAAGELLDEHGTGNMSVAVGTAPAWLSLAVLASGVVADKIPPAAGLYVLGGSNPNTPPLGQAAFFSPAAGANGTWTTRPAMGYRRASGRAASLDGNVYYIGGSNGDNYPYRNSTLKYSPAADPGAGAWSQLAGIPFAVTDPTDAPDGSGISTASWRSAGFSTPSAARTARPR